MNRCEIQVAELKLFNVARQNRLFHVYCAYGKAKGTVFAAKAIEEGISLSEEGMNWRDEAEPAFTVIAIARRLPLFLSARKRTGRK